MHEEVTSIHESLHPIASLAARLLTRVDGSEHRYTAHGIRQLSEALEREIDGGRLYDAIVALLRVSDALDSTGSKQAARALLELACDAESALSAQAAKLELRAEAKRNRKLVSFRKLMGIPERFLSSQPATAPRVQRPERPAHPRQRAFVVEEG